MITIVREQLVADGYDVTADVDGNRYHVHFLSKPTEAFRDAKIQEIHEAYIAQQSTIELEDGTNA